MQLTAMPEQSLSCRLDREPAEVRHAREAAGKALSGWGLDEHAGLAEIIVSELVTNAIIHGDGTIMARISYAGGCLRIEVHDDGPGRPARREAAAADESGRGLALIDGLIEPYGGTRSVTSDGPRGGSGKTVRVAVRLGGSP